MKKILFFILFSVGFVLISNAQPTLSLGAEINLVTAYQKDFEKQWMIGYEPGLFVNFSVLNQMGLDSKVTYQHLSKDNISFASTTLIQYYGQDYSAFGIGPVFYIPENNDHYSFSNLKYGVAVGFGSKYMGINASVEDFDFKQPTIILHLFIRIPFIDKYVKM